MDRLRPARRSIYDGPLFAREPGAGAPWPTEPPGERRSQMDRRPARRQAFVALFLFAALVVAVLTGMANRQPDPAQLAAQVVTATPPPPTPTDTPVPTATATATPSPTPENTPLPDTPTAVPPTATPVPTATPLPPTPTPLPPVGAPVRLQIPKIGVNAAVESVGLTPDGAMGVPQNHDNVAWYNLGPKPGEPGQAVIDGHVDSTTGPAVFWDLNKLKPGDQIIVVGSDKIARKFVIRTIEAYPEDQAPLQKIFGPAPGTHLNLITCDQSTPFDHSRHTYLGRLVIYADLAP